MILLLEKQLKGGCEIVSGSLMINKGLVESGSECCNSISIKQVGGKSDTLVNLYTLIF